MNIIDICELEKPASNYLGDPNSVMAMNALSWETIADYTMFLTLKNGGCSKMSSGQISVTWGQRWATTEARTVQADLGGYDLITGSRHQNFEAKSELELKIQIVKFLEQERLAQLQDQENSEKEF